jgi:DNA-directed RNA polymerase beta subunit
VNVKGVRDERVTIEVKRECCAAEGDKFCSPHGQKGVISVLPDDEMPVMIDRREFKVDVVIGYCSMVTRGTYSQWLEALLGQKCIDDGEDYYWDDEFTEEQLAALMKTYESRVYLNGRVLYKREDGRDVAIKVSFGNIRLIQTPFMTYENYAFTRTLQSSTSKRVSSGRVNGGSSTLGEMELEQLLAVGLPGVMQEFRLRGDMITVDICRVCNCILMICPCESRGPTAKCNISFSAVKYICAVRSLSGMEVRLYHEDWSL